MAAPADKYARFVLLREDEPKLSMSEYARRLGVSKALVKFWIDGDRIPKGADDAIQILRAEKRGAIKAVAAVAIANAAITGDGPTISFEEAVKKWATKYPKHALALPIDRMKALKRLLKNAKDLREQGDLRGEAQALGLFLAQARQEESHLRELGLPSLVATLSAAYRNVESVPAVDRMAEIKESVMLAAALQHQEGYDPEIIMEHIKNLNAEHKQLEDQESRMMQ